MANSKDRDAADEMTRVPMQHAVDEWTRGVQEGLTRYQEMFSQLPGFDVNGAEVGGSVAREQLIEFNTDLLSYAQGSLNDSFEASKAVINAANMQEAMQIQIAHARKAMQQRANRRRSWPTAMPKPVARSPSPCRAARTTRPSRPGRSVSKAPTRPRIRRVS